MKHRFKNIVNNNKTKEDYNNMIKSIKTWILVGFASLLLVACGQGGGGAGSKKSKTLENTKKAGFVNVVFHKDYLVFQMQMHLETGLV